jgi:hypothetical protein
LFLTTKVLAFVAAAFMDINDVGGEIVRSLLAPG